MIQKREHVAQKGGRMVSLKTIASQCGVSIATVSKALNDQSDISTETKERVRKVAQELGYLPNAAARALKTKRSYNIGVLFEDEAGRGLTHEYFSGVLNGIKVQSEKLGYDTLDDYYAYLKEKCENTCFEDMILYYIIRCEDLNYTDEYYSEQVLAMVKDYQIEDQSAAEDFLNYYYGIDNVKEEIRMKYAQKWVADNAKVREDVKTVYDNDLNPGMKSARDYIVHLKNAPPKIGGAFKYIYSLRAFALKVCVSIRTTQTAAAISSVISKSRSVCVFIRRRSAEAFSVASSTIFAVPQNITLSYPAPKPQAVSPGIIPVSRSISTKTFAFFFMQSSLCPLAAQ